MTDLTKMKIAEARDLMKKGDLSSRELTEAHIAAVDAADSLNAYIVKTPEIALKSADAADKKIKAGEQKGMTGIPVGIKDLFATKGVHTQACSHILDGFKPEYESTVTQNLWDDGAVMLGKLNMDEFAMGSSNETSYYGPVKILGAQPAATMISYPGAPLAVRSRRFQGMRPWAQQRLTPAALFVSLLLSLVHSVSSLPTAAAAATAWWRFPARLIRLVLLPVMCATAQ